MVESKSALVGPLKVLVVEDDTLVGMGLKSQLQKLGHTFIGQAANSTEATALFQQHQPELVLLDIRLDDADGIELATQFNKERRTPMIIISAYSDTALVQRASDAGVFGYLIKPVSQEALAAQIQVSVKRFREYDQSLQENQALAQSLEQRKLVERAKGIMMKRLQLDEPEAYRRLQQESQKRRISLGEIARKVIESEELLSG